MKTICFASRKGGVGKSTATVLVARDSPSLSEEFVRHTVGEVPEMRESVRNSLKAVDLNRECVSSPEELKRIIETL